ncbi:MAG: transposase [Proteobacteria bacterium]|nr:transposase [Pseudomonadota bacterium]MBU4432742.1 transposase [Patescibacteria group bacterium]MBU4470058.1 transposase [Pseudomonadota bacterium]MCG2750703.1 transposase [Desulfobacteraceae bacterium]
MLFEEPLPFIKDYVEQLNGAIKACCPGEELSRIQKRWLSFCVMSIIVTNSVCWARFRKVGMGRYGIAALSWMFRKSRIPWDLLLQISVGVVLKRYGITEGNIGIDDTDKKRSKSTKRLYQVHKIKDKPSGGYVMGQSIVFLVLITPKITIPVGFSFHMPDPALSAWQKKDNELKAKGVPKKKRPAKPHRDPDYPTMPQIALSLLEHFRAMHPEILIRCIFADALYGTEQFLSQASSLFGGIQVISQIRSNQLVRYRGRDWSVQDYFATFPGTEQTMTVRGGEKIKATIGSARLHVKAHRIKRFVIALKYEGEEEYRYIIASDLSWRTLDIVEAYTLRWLVEVFFQDWKGNEGWGKMTKQTGEEGSSRSLILSLLVDHCLFFHPTQVARLENKLPACTVGSLMDQIRVEGLLDTFEQIVLSEAPAERFKTFAKSIEDNMVLLRPSKKHMINRNIGNFEPSPSLHHRKAA